MNESIYAPPEADVTAPATGEESSYYVVSPLKFVLLSILTFTLYFVYWFYRNWRQVQERDNSAIWPAPRGFFFIFFTHSLFGDINDRLKQTGSDFKWRPMALATVFVLVTFLGNLIDHLIPMDDYSLFALTVPFMAIFLGTFLLLPAQKAANAASNDIGGTSNARFTAANWVWMLLGGAIWALNLLGIVAILSDPTFS